MRRLIPVLIPVAVATLLAGLVVPLVGAHPAEASAAKAVSELYPRPADGVYDLAGHGWGHGRGMSQHGAYGAALQGHTADQITGFYYPGTAKAKVANSTIRVQITDDGADTRVQNDAGKLTVREVSTGKTMTMPAGPTAWRAVVSGSAMYLQSLTGTVWTTERIGGRASFPGPFVFSAGSYVRVDLPGGIWRDYRGSTYAVRTGSTTVASVVQLPLEDYLRGVVPRESPASWPAAALQAQAIAARSYSINKRDRVAGTGIADICDTTACQVFGGSRLRDAAGTVTTLEAPTTNGAIAATAGVVRTYQGKAIFAEFSSSNGGFSTAGDLPYLVAKADPFDGVPSSTVHSWTAALPVSDLEKAFPQIGYLLQMRITDRDGNGEWGGRVGTVVLEGTTGKVTTDGRALYLARPWPAVADGLKHQWFKPVAEAAAPVFTGALAFVVGMVDVPRNGQTTSYYDVRNTGTASWAVPGPVRSSSLTPGAPSHAASWLGPTRPGPIAANVTVPGATTVAPGQVARFGIVLAGNGRTPGTRVEDFGVLWEGFKQTPIRARIYYRIV